MLIVMKKILTTKNAKKIRNILRAVYSEPMVKNIMSLRRRPAQEKQYVFLEQNKIPLEAWRDIRAWIIKQDEKNRIKHDKSNTA